MGVGNFRGKEKGSVLHWFQDSGTGLSPLIKLASKLSKELKAIIVIEVPYIGHNVGFQFNYKNGLW